MPVGSQPIQICPATGGPVLVYNNDLVNVSYVGYAYSITSANAVPIQPLGSVIMDGSSTLWGFCVGGSALLSCVPGGTQMTPSPAQVAAQIQLLGLMKDTTGQAIKTSADGTTAAVNAPAFGPMKDATGTAIQTAVNASTSAINNLPANLQPVMNGASVLRQGTPGSPYTLQTFLQSSRIWAVILSLFAGTTAAYAAGITNIFAEVLLPTAGVPLSIVELGVSSAGQIISDTAPVAFAAGLQANPGDTIQLNVNNGTALANGNIRASAIAIYSTP